ncbi:MAG: O-antigen ligase family protein [Acidobacteriota bacterium]|nr:O-antigen ligase family protein [Acidobacteriota bacterium]
MRAAMGLLVCAGPLMVFPELVPAGARTWAVTTATMTALGVGWLLLFHIRTVRFGLGLFIGALAAGWLLLPNQDPVGLRHFGGVGAGVLTMAVLASWARTAGRLSFAATVFALAAIAVLTLGSMNAFINNSKFITGADQRVWSTPVAPMLPLIMMGLPGMERNEGQVNQNALAGTALMLAPTCAGLVAAAFFVRRHRYVMAVPGALAVLIAFAVLARTLSRTAWLAAIVMLVLLAVRFRRTRYWVLGALIATAVATIAVSQLRSADFGDGVRSVTASLETREAIWKAGARRLWESPWLGAGINQFHELTPGDGAPPISHAHNMLLQVALDVGVAGAIGYGVLISTLLARASRLAHRADLVGRIGAGAGLSLAGVHLFGLADAIALGAKVGAFQWLCSGLILAASQLTLQAPAATASESAITDARPQPPPATTPPP